MKKRSIDYFKRYKTFIAMSHTPSVKKLLEAEFFASKSLVVKKDILKTLESMQKSATTAPIVETNDTNSL